MKNWTGLLLTGVSVCGMFFTAETAGANENSDFETRLKALEKELEERNAPLTGISISGQMTMIYQGSSLSLQNGVLDTTNSANTNYQEYDHKRATASFSSDLVIEKELANGDSFIFNLEFANGAGVDAPLQGGGMVNNDIMEDDAHHNQPYLARAYYETAIPMGREDYQLTLDIGKFGIPDFFDEGERVADQTTQFLNQAICNNGAFDYVQDLQGHGYTYGIRAALQTPYAVLSGAVMSSDAYLDNIADKHSVIGSISFSSEYSDEIKGSYRLYMFRNYGEYAAFDDNGSLLTQDAASINTSDNKDTLDKGGFGISIDQSLPLGINLFGKYGHQDDDRDVRHYQDMDETIMFGFDLSGEHWKRPSDLLGVAYEIGKLTGNHRKAHEMGYQGFFDRPGIGDNYADEKVLEIYYNIALTENTSLGLDYQRISNFYYSSQIGNVDFWAGRFNMTF